MPKVPTRNIETAGMEALVIYDDFVCAAKANTALQRAAHNAETIVQWNVRPWRLDALRLPPASDEALKEAMHAHLIVFTGNRAQSFPFWLETWMDRWANERQIKDAVLAVMGGTNDARLSPPHSPELASFARRHGLNFIIPGEEHLTVPTRTDLARRLEA